ncbi:hypothetical protein F5144DRAFT_594191 [Chaetomium tenue]|uniref:Uncharacterized protein n=1 Tax=Chaetomium tenue TaxID=1854479 RepID=A0ACB7P820_9PEZI|nr:hypothetical protein F5144DRAFT_594191 [Chaetomium globosum]
MSNKITYKPVHPRETTEDDEHDDSPLLAAGQEKQGPRNSQYSTTCLLVTLVVVAAAATLVSGTAGFVWGRHVEKSRAESDWFSPPGRIDHTFKYRWQFSARPSNNESQIWWNKVFPKGRGFIQHPEISPVPHGLAVFHQLHCLVRRHRKSLELEYLNLLTSIPNQDAIRHGYYSAVDGTEPIHFAKPGHIRHCIDYLRQSIMCNADTNLEPIDSDLNGVTGWGFPRKCRDIVRLIGWAQKWRTHNQTGHH